MNNPDPSPAVRTLHTGKRKLSRDTVFLVGDLLPLCDFTGVLLAAYFAALLYANWSAAVVLPAGLWDDIGRAALVAAVLAPLILCDRAFVAFANGGQTGALVRCYAVRFAMFAGVVATIGFASRALQGLPQGWLALWLASCLLLTALTRWLLIAGLRRLERAGILTETVAVVGAGPLADRLVDHLRRTRGSSVEILGVFDDKPGDGHDGREPIAGTVEQLIELGQVRPLDWVLLALPGSTEGQVDELARSIVHRLKTLAVPIGLCPQDVDLEPLSTPGAGYRQTTRDSLRAAAQAALPPWILTLLALPLWAFRWLLHDGPQPRKLHLSLDDYDLERFTGVAARFGQQRYGYVVTPNADHMIRLHREPVFRALYADAAYVLLDSRFIAKLLRLTQKRQLPVCTGSDLTAKLFDEVIRPHDRLVMIGGSTAQAARLRARYGLQQLAHFNPPMGFIHNPAAVESCLRFIENHSPFRYCLLAVGAPQQEILAQHLKTRGTARGLALCVGASINFLTGDEQRAPLWLQRSGMEWLFRLLQAPGRMAGRYLVRGPQIFVLLRRTEIVLRTARTPSHSHTPAVAMPRPFIPSTADARIAAPVPPTDKLRTRYARARPHTS